MAGIVKLYDIGLHVRERANALARATGRGILRAAPWLRKFLSIAGTAAMFLVGGGILVHAIPFLHHLSVDLSGDGTFAWLIEALVAAGVGIVAGIVVLVVVDGIRRLRGRPAAAH